ncbi:endoplasmic reticulum junction formation protein lunapark [Holotrichia oblita]|uniref:Endoplasmic reticulum junction formation protein lunapark n=2 Tax=Holotrichia oblita TaxID=644536 RepID=A0ACB9TPD9_HOLOL|nr:endoplasmic reticulum junction formation protein lunapark [Holotrichia oblita]KAI4468505.1 endoplasmic reticulum junction formation protein lunapark [Holotrichia oblita]
MGIIITKFRLSDEKKKILENVMETETYKKAKIILEKYAPEQIRKSNSFPVPSSDIASPNKSNLTTNVIAPTPGLRHRVLPSSQIAKTPYSGLQTPTRPLPITASMQTMARVSSTSMASIASQPGVSGTPLPLPRAILPRERSVFDKMVEYLVGDGPSNRYALICRQCSSHNGMALKEEFEYLSFRCCYCYFLNPARKKRPPAPKLQIEAKQQLSIHGPDTSESEKNSSTDTDSEQETKSSPARLPQNLNALYPKEKEPSSDSEKNDFDKLSDAEFKHSDNEKTPMEVDNDYNETQDTLTQTEEITEYDKQEVVTES